MRDRVGEFLREETPRRAISLAIFLGLLVLFHKVLLLLVFFVSFERVLRAGAGFLHRKLGLSAKVSLLLVAVVLLALLGTMLALGVGRSVRAIHHARADLPARIATMRAAPWFVQAEEHFSDAAERIVQSAESYAGAVIKVLSAFGHGLLFALIGFILAVVFLLEKHELDEFHSSIPPHSLRGTLLRWFGFVAEAMLVMVQFQLVVAACNAALTLPVLLLLGIPHAPSLVVLIFVSGLVPVVGNVASGAILSMLAFQVKGWAGVGIFVSLTFVLHKLESYYLNPRLAARHVRLPGFVLIISLLLFEQVFGFLGLFLSFPALYVAQRIRTELAADHAAATDAGPYRQAADVAVEPVAVATEPPKV